MEYLDIVNETGQPTGETVSRDIAHRDGIRHRTAHVYVPHYMKKCEACSFKILCNGCSDCGSCFVSELC